MATPREQKRRPVLSTAERTAIVSHMNDDHAEVVLLYAKTFAELPQASAAAMTGIDETGMDLNVTCNRETTHVRIAFEQPLRNPGEARRTLIDMAATARRLCINDV